MKSYLSVVGISKLYNKFVAVDDISLEIEKGEFVTFLGPSGSGKSTLLYMIAGLQEATKGEVSLHGKSLLTTPPNKRNIGMVFQRYTLIPHVNVADNIAFPLRVRHWPQVRIDARVKQMLHLVRLENYATRMPSQLSGGQQQRVALARALSYDPEILLMDEPLAALDKKLKEDLQIEIRRIHRETGATILYVTHDQEEALRLSDRIAVFNQGRIEQIAVGRSLYDDPSSKFVASFVGNSNFLPATVTHIDDERIGASMPDGTVVNARAASKMPLGATGVLLVRPEQLAVLPHTAADALHGLLVSVQDATYLGETMQISAMTSWQQMITVRCRPADFQSHIRDGKCRVGLLSADNPLLLFSEPATDYRSSANSR
jgi:putative spermidine/putrescine transport system ATP-binding protein